VQARLRPKGLGIKVFDGYRPVRAMESEGFTNYEKEWWHFSYQVDGAVPFDRVIR
jgi:D-alanyl-D-alanine dipeptidase